MSQRISSANLAHALDMHWNKPKGLQVIPKDEAFKLSLDIFTARSEGLTTYGLTRETVNNFRCLMAYGLPHDRAMVHLKRLYDNNKHVALNPINPIQPN
ncbi:hypothetical protein HOR70_gp03 [Pectobacterium phage PPWS4]|uniref:Uncharacterized protein n=1 Tax=Pectobacterium phage PPWS4 TaxID=1961914 RepID=A0A286P063_9CAUD|nr:hypothetical protein HOR70_gp03 [Pectobacterium phage PPWS4]BBA26418.1 hypothetical protein [Pectobacterium phage PPWS4]